MISQRIAVGSGASGEGFLLRMPEQAADFASQATDFIFSVSSEEFGFLGGIVVLLLFTVLFCRIVGAGAQAGTDAPS